MSCPRCDNWVQLDEDQPRYDAEGYGFTCHLDDSNKGEDKTHFTCDACNCPAEHEYFKIKNGELTPVTKKKAA